MPIAILKNEKQQTWSFEVTDDTGTVVDTSRDYTTKWGAVKASHYYEIHGTLPTKYRTPYKGQTTAPATHARRKLLPEQVLEIRASTEPAAVLMERYGIAKSTVSMVRTGRNYGWVKG